MKNKMKMCWKWLMATVCSCHA